jgi:acyl-CoA synthetase (AMP-forming)/AMP-acid ligase II
MSLPLCHVFGATMSATALGVGAEITMFRRFDLDESLRHIRDAGVTIWPMAGAVAHRLAQRDDLHPADFASLRLFMWGGSAAPVEYATAITARTGVPFLCSYGMTEAMMVAFNPIDRPDEWRLDSPGYPTIGTELRLTESRELQVRGPSVASGYAVAGGDDSAAFTADGWFHTGDLAELEPDGRVKILDRLKDMIKVSGFQVAPSEVENALLTHPLVTDVAVVGRPDDRTGETPVAFVVTTDSVSIEALEAWLRQRVSKYKRPTSYVFVDELPRTVGGKLKRGELRAR